MVRPRTVYAGAMGKPTDPAYWRTYRATHPEYAARDRARNRVRKATRAPRLDRSAEYARRNAGRASGPIEPILELHYGHPLFDQARELVAPIAYTGMAYRFPSEVDREDARSEAVLAILEGRDAVEAVRSFLAGERGRRLVEAPLLEY